MEQKNLINIEEELKQSEQRGKRWKPQGEGVFELTFLSEPEPDVFVDKDGKTNHQVRFNVDVVGAGLNVWTIPRSQSSLGLWIQLCTWVKDKGGRFSGQHCRFKVLGTDKQRRYTVLD